MAFLQDPIDRAGTNSIKWDRRAAKFGREDIIPLWIADTDFPAPPQVSQAIQIRAGHSLYGYSFPSAEYLQAIAGWFSRRHGLQVETRWIHPTIGVVTGLAYTIQALTEPKEKVMTTTPVYDPFYTIIRSADRTLVEAPLIREGDSYRLDLESMEQGFRDGVKLLLFCNPHNPTGRVWRDEELSAVAHLCQQYGVCLASDEVHCDLALFGSRFRSMLLWESLHDRLVVCTSPGKTFNLAGLCSANLIIPNDSIRQKVADKLRGAWIMSPNLFAVEATCAAYQNGDEWLKEKIAYLEDNSRLVVDFARRYLPGVGVTRHEGTFLMWLDFSCLGLPSGDLSAVMVERCGLGLGDGLQYGSAGAGFLRLNIGCHRTLLEQALKAMTTLFQ